MHAFLLNFFDLHADKFVKQDGATVDFFMAGESHAGHYVPHLAKYVLDRNGEAQNRVISLAGLAIGNGWTEPRYQYAGDGGLRGPGADARVQGAPVWYVGSSAAPAGYVKNAYGQLTYLAVLDSGHMVPMDALAGVDMIDRCALGAPPRRRWPQSISTTAGGADWLRAGACARRRGRRRPTPADAAARRRASPPPGAEPGAMVLHGDCLRDARAYVAPAVSKPATALNGKQEMVELAEANPDFLGSTIGFWDPFNLIAEGDFWGLGNEATIGYLRHAEIKHGRVAMAGFSASASSRPIAAGDYILKPYSGYVSNVSPQEQWENVPAIGKLQILVLVGMLES
ncbi:serine carboxypeptidase [Aureococcus anophagefferens]|nr:serine carboxypeptidase [Aureococcus anophagefferens]